MRHGDRDGIGRIGFRRHAVQTVEPLERRSGHALVRIGIERTRSLAAQLPTGRAWDKQAVTAVIESAAETVR